MIEHFTPLWFVAFMVNVTLGCICFYYITKKYITEQYQGLGWWMGWWAFVDAISLVLNATMGVNYFWSYHQTGIISDTAINIGLVWFLVKWLLDNWPLNDEDWQKIYKIRKEAKIRELSK